MTYSFVVFVPQHVRLKARGLAEVCAVAGVAIVGGLRHSAAHMRLEKIINA